MKRKQWMAFLLAGAMAAATGQSIAVPTLAAESEAATDDANGISVTENDSVLEISCTDPIVVLNDDLALITINGVKLDKEEGRLWYYYSIKNKSEDQYIHPFFSSESFGDYMVDYSSCHITGGTSSIPGGKWSALRGSGTEKIDNIKTIDDLKRFSATITLYISDSPNSYSSTNQSSSAFDIDFDSLDGVTRLSDTGETLVPPLAELPDGYQPEGATLTTTDEYAELTFDEPYVILDNEMAEVAITSLKLVYNDKIWYYYTVKNKTSDKYLREFFSNEAFNDVMVNYSVCSAEGSSDSIPAGKNSGIKGFGSEDLTNISGPADLLNFSGTLRIYPSSEANSYGSEDPCESAFSIQLSSDAAGTETSSEAAAGDDKTATGEAATEDTASDSTEASAAAGEAASAEDVEAMLQGIWTLQDVNSFTFKDGSFTIISADASVMSGTYSVDTDAKEIRLSIDSTDGQPVKAGLPYTTENGVLSIYNDNGIALVKQDGDTAPAADAASDTDAAAGMDTTSAEELEAQLSSQPLIVRDAEVTDENDSRFDVSFSTSIVLPHILNQSAGDVKYLEIKVAGWDKNNLPVTLKSSYMSYASSEEIGISFDSANVVEGMELNSDDADNFYLIPVDVTCGLAKAKCIVSTYTTYDGDTWTNPLLSAWEDTYVGKKLVEPVVYTDQETIQKVQAALNEAGYECGTPDGIAGAKTYEALNAYQKANDLPVTNDITDSLLKKMNLQ